MVEREKIKFIKVLEALARPWWTWSLHLGHLIGQAS